MRHLPGVSRPRERVLPNGNLQIIIDLSAGTKRRGPAAIVVGARMRHEILDPMALDEVLGVELQPGGFPALFGERADLVFEQTVAVDALWRDANVVEQLADASTPSEKLAVFDMLLARRLRAGAERSAPVDRAIEYFRRERGTVASCARSVGISERRLSQAFREQVGLSPKSWCRLRRFQSALRVLHSGIEVPWAELALDCGYYDQSHFANEFRAFSGIDPTTYTRRRGAWRNHVAVD
jgi:AraC-like DNA-binding protein